MLSGMDWRIVIVCLVVYCLVIKNINVINVLRRSRVRKEKKTNKQLIPCFVDDDVSNLASFSSACSPWIMSPFMLVW